MSPNSICSPSSRPRKLGGICVRTVRRMCEGRLTEHKVGRRVFVTRESYNAHLGKQPPADDKSGRNGGPTEDWDGFEIPALDAELERRRLACEARVAA